jgi:3-oxosteroid 1-dehydrogenase
VTNEDAPVIVVGAGLSGLAVALMAALRGRRSVVLEASDKVGGAAAWSGGQVWVGANHVAARAGIDDDLTRAEAYVRAIGAAHPEMLDEVALMRWLTVAPTAMRHWEEVGAVQWEIIPDLADYHDYAPGALAEGRYLTSAVIDGAVLQEWRDRLLVSPYFPVGTTYADMYLKGRRAANLGTNADDTRPAEDTVIADHAGVPAFGRTTPAQRRQRTDGADPLTFGTGLVAGFLAQVLRQDNIDLRLSSPVIALLRTKGGAVSGVRVHTSDGERDILGPVVLATSSFDWDPEAVAELLGLGPDDFGSIAPKTIRGDGLRMARDAGAAVVRIPPTAVPMPPGWRTADAQGYANGPEYALPHAMIVDAAGRRFCDDSYWVDIVRKGLAPDDPHVPFFLIWDEQHHRTYGLGSSAPGEPYPDGLVTAAPTLSDLGTALGIDGAALAATADRFSRQAEAGVDPDFGRGSVPFIARFAGDPAHEPNPLLGDVAQPPFYGMRMVYVGTAIGMSGVHIDADAHVLDSSGNPIPGLYAVGSVAASTTMGTAYNSGFALSRGLTHAYLVGRELAAHSAPSHASR